MKMKMKKIIAFRWTAKRNKRRQRNKRNKTASVQTTVAIPPIKVHAMATRVMTLTATARGEAPV